MARRVGFGQPDKATAPDSHDGGEGSGRRGQTIGWVVLMIPLGFALIGVWLLIDTAGFLAVARPTKGEVIAVEADSSGDGVTYRPTVRYFAHDGTLHEAPTFTASSGYDYRIGTWVEILYDPAEPDEVRINNPLSLWLLPIGFAGLGSLLFGVFLGAMLRAKRVEAEKVHE